ncbi:hypothetical protein BIY24_06800 [Halobacteriovorax marinus]|uniref:fatty acid CoA ligase family protein n=1 Tax=Halobacteriovorax marinus TaxID=97084 RepID=UPI000BC34C1D|nr:fatty acid CoA ligase family protein [Halobacteriovorax marinus]ATH07662.1 hypothetical protein BIY24_06800 [Halobacteriovorax marinus]
MNIAQLLEQRAKEHPTKDAIRAPKGRKSNGEYHYESLSFKDLLDRSRSIANGLKAQGLMKGDKAIVFIRPGLDFPAVTFALFSLGIIPVFIDPGMGKENLLRSIKQVRPKALIAVPIVHFLRLFKRDAFKSVEVFITTGSLTWPGLKSLQKLKSYPSAPVQSDIDENELAAILFTSGGTGIPKGVEYTHRIFSKQTELLQKIFSLTPADTDIPGFPLFALFTIAMGMTSCIPDMDPSKPAKADPQKLIQNIIDNKATFVAGSPAIWDKVAKYCVQNNLTLPSVKYMVMFGAPVSKEIHADFSKVLTGGTTYTPYGATESLPVANISGKYLLENTAQKSLQGLGTCVGAPIDEVEIKIIEITDEIIPTVDDMKELKRGAIGEIIVKGETVTKRYFEMPEKTLEAKIYDGESLWHRIGDIGYLDDDGQLWFCGRKTHRVQSEKGLMSSIQCEAIFNRHENVEKSALVGIVKGGYEEPQLVVQLRDKSKKSSALKEELLKMGQAYDHTKEIKTIWFHDNFPVDVRHNIKIDRLKLRDMASRGELQ